MRDLVNPKWMVAKAALFLAVLASSCSLLLLEAPRWRTALLLTLVIWASARLYYFMFYVIERYIDPSYRFSGIGSALHFWQSRRSQEEQRPDPHGDP